MESDKRQQWQILKYVVFGPLALIALTLAASIATGLAVAMLEPNLGPTSTDKVTDTIVAVATLIVQLIVVSAQPLAVRLWIDLAHKSGRTAAIEEKIAKQQAT